MGIIRTVLTGLAFLFWIFGLLILMSSLLAGAIYFYVSVGMIVVGIVFFLGSKALQKNF